MASEGGKSRHVRHRAYPSPAGYGSPSLSHLWDSRIDRPRLILSPQRLFTYSSVATISSWLSSSPNAGIALLKLGTSGVSWNFPPWLTMRYRRPSAWCHVCPSPLSGGAGSVPFSLRMCQFGCPSPLAPWQAAQRRCEYLLP